MLRDSLTGIRTKLLLGYSTCEIKVRKSDKIDLLLDLALEYNVKLHLKVNMCEDGTG